MNKAIVIIGAGGHAISVTNVAHSGGFNVVAYVDDHKSGSEIMEIPVISTQQCLSQYQTHNLCVAIGDNAVRERAYLEYKDALPNASFPSLIHSSSVVGIAAEIGEGAVVMPLCNVGPQSKIGNCCILNTGSSLDHDCVMSDFSSLAPHVVCGGNVEIAERSAISIGATVKHGVKIGSDVVIGANSYVNKPVEEKVVAFGIPCIKIRDRNKGDAYLG